MPVVLLLAAVAILGGTVVAALGGAGRMAEFPADFPPVDGVNTRPADLFALRAPMSLWGYHPAAMDETLKALVMVMNAREAQIAALRREVAELRAASSDSVGQPGPGVGD